MENIVIRNATTNDLTQIIELYKQLHETEQPFDFNLMEPAQYYKSEPFKKNTIRLEKEIRSKKIKFLVATLENEVLGYISGSINKPHCYNNNVLLCNELVVSLEQRQKGIGKKLILCLIEWGKKKEAVAIHLSIFEKNLKALSVYKKMGFENHFIRLYKKI